MKKLTRAQAKEALETIPLSHVLGGAATKALTAKQRRFAQEVAKGSTKADAWRAAYPNPAQSTLRSDPYKLANNPRIVREIEAYQLAVEASKHRTPAALRELVIQSLVQVVIDPDSKASVKVAAAKVLGTVTEVAAFTERKEVRTITSSEDARARVMGELRQLIAAGASDATIIEDQADELLAELGGNLANQARAGGADNQDQDPPDADDQAPGVTHPHPTPRCTVQESASVLHTIPPEVPPIQADLEHPPSSNF
jgi:phage terminase small subunit